MNISFKSWYIDININDNIFINHLDYLINYLKKNSAFLLDLNKDNFSYIEKIIYDIILFHCDNLKINLDDKYVSFWAKDTEYNFDYIHMHVDHCDYESRIFDLQIKKPLFTTILYINDNTTPTLITNVKKDDKNFNKNDNMLIFTFPKKFKNIIFDSNYYHGEAYLKNTKLTERKVIVIALWDKNNKPLYMPYFNNDCFNFFIFNYYYYKIHEENENFYLKKNNIVSFKNSDNNSVSLKTYDKELINNLFNNLIIDKKKDCLYKFNDIFKNFNNVDTFIVKFNL